MNRWRKNSKRIEDVILLNASHLLKLYAEVTLPGSRYETNVLHRDLYSYPLHNTAFFLIVRKIVLHSVRYITVQIPVVMWNDNRSVFHQL